MKENIFDKVMNWVKSNPLMAAGAGLLAIILFFPKIFRAARRRRSRRSYRPVVKYTRRRSLPRSVGLTRRGVPRKQYTKGGKAKKAWQIKGSLAARRHMAQIRKLR